MCCIVVCVQYGKTAYEMALAMDKVVSATKHLQTLCGKTYVNGVVVVSLLDCQSYGLEFKSESQKRRI